MIVPTAILLLAAASPTYRSGEVVRGQEYRTDIGAGLVFVLSPSDTGWMIGVIPRTQCAEATEDWASVVNAPYRNYNALFVDASYGITAQEAVEKMHPREFSFEVTCAAYKADSERLSIVMWPYNFRQREVDEALAKLGSAPLGKGKFTILKSKVSPAAHDIDGKNYGQIDWLKFKLDVTLPSSVRR